MGIAAVLYVVACGAPPSADIGDFAQSLQGDGWEVCVIATPAGAGFVDADALARQTGHPVRAAYKRPEEPDVLPEPDAFAVAPATFNTVNKWAHGMSDTLALGLLNEAIGSGAPIVAAPWPNAALAAHPVFRRSVDVLTGWGVDLVFDPAGLPGNLPKDQASFPWGEVRAAVGRMRARLPR